MSLTSALNSAVSALTAQSAAIASVSENIANASTTAYKTSDVSFRDLITGSSDSGLSSGTVAFSTTQNMTSQGALTATDSSTDIAITGGGFFVVAEATDDTASAFQYSRNGSFSTDKNGYLINSEGYYLLGQKTDANGNVIASNSTDLNSLEPVNTTTISGSAKATTEVSLTANLPADATTLSTFTTASEIFDSLGISSTINQTWTKTGANTWTVDLADPYLTSDSSVSTGTTSPSTLTLTFNNDGSFASTTPDPLDVTVTGFSTGAADAAFTLDLSGLTQYSSNSTTPGIESFASDQDGVRYGKLSSISIDDGGLVTAAFDNGLRQPIYQIPIATFSNPEGLTHVNGTVYDENQNAGTVSLRQPGDGNAGTITGNALESSTTDTSAEFNRMIVAQQAYSAAAQVISTTKSMFDTLISSVR